MTNPLISIIIPTVNRGDILKETIKFLSIAIENIHVEVILVNDNKSKLIDASNFNISQLIVLNNPKSGPASARNLGAKHAQSNLLLFLDDDILVQKQHILKTISLHQNGLKVAYNFNWKYPETITQTLQQHSFGRFMVKHQLINYQGWVRDIDWSRQECVEVHKLAAFYFSIPRASFFEVGGFNEDFLFQGVEDDELSFRLKKKGISLFIITNQYVLHNEIDRQELHARLIRMKNASINRRKAYEMGMKECKIHYGISKKLLIRLLIPFKSLFFKIINIIPSSKKFDFMYFKIAEILFVIYIFEGYYGLFEKRKE